MVAKPPVMWTGADEARALGVHPSTVSRARRDPTHPANSDAARRVRTITEAPAINVVGWWAGLVLDPADRPRGGRPSGPTPDRIRMLATEHGIPFADATPIPARTEEQHDA